MLNNSALVQDGWDCHINNLWVISSLVFFFNSSLVATFLFKNLVRELSTWKCSRTLKTGVSWLRNLTCVSLGADQAYSLFECVESSTSIEEFLISNAAVGLIALGTRWLLEDRPAVIGHVLRGHLGHVHLPWDPGQTLDLIPEVWAVPEVLRGWGLTMPGRQSPPRWPVFVLWYKISCLSSGSAGVLSVRLAIGHSAAGFSLYPYPSNV